MSTVTAGSASKVKRAEEWKGSSLRDDAQPALALLVTCHCTCAEAAQADFLVTGQTHQPASTPVGLTEIGFDRDCASAILFV